MFMWFVLFLLIVFLVFDYVIAGIGYGYLMRTRGMKYSWLAWIPILNQSYVLGAISDHINADYHQKSHRRIFLLISRIVTIVFSMIILVLTLTALNPLFSLSSDQLANTDAVTAALQQIDPSVQLVFLPLLLVGLAVGIVGLIFQFLSWYGIFKEYDARHAGVYLIIAVLCLFFFSMNFLGTLFVLTCRKNTPQFVQLNSKHAFH